MRTKGKVSGELLLGSFYRNEHHIFRGWADKQTIPMEKWWFPAKRVQEIATWTLLLLFFFFKVENNIVFLGCPLKSQPLLLLKSVHPGKTSLMVGNIIHLPR